jgi:hypothetical protein
MPKKRRPRTPRKICAFCQEGFEPDYRHGDNQKACKKEECQRRRHSQATANWKKNNPEKVRDYYAKYVKPWRADQRRLKLAAESVCSKSSGLALGMPSVHQVRDQINAYVCGCFKSLEHELNLAAVSSMAAPAKKNACARRRVLVLGDA